MAIAEKISPSPEAVEAWNALKQRAKIPEESVAMPHLYRERPDDDPSLPDLNSQIVGRAIAIGIRKNLFSTVMLVTDCSVEETTPIAEREEAYIKNLVKDTPHDTKFITQPKAQTTMHEARVFRKIADDLVDSTRKPHHLVDIALAAHIPRVRYALAQNSAFGIVADTVQVVSAEDIILLYGDPGDREFLRQHMKDSAYLALYERERDFTYAKLAQGPLAKLADWYARVIDTGKDAADRVNRRALRRVQKYWY